MIKRLVYAFTLFLAFLSLAEPTSASSVVLNEIAVHPVSGNDWIELYNSTTSTIDLSNWSLFDNASSMKVLSGTIDAQGFAYFEVSNRLNNSGDSVFLKDASGATVDDYLYTSDPGTGVSLGRVTDAGTWTILTYSSQNASNETSSTPIPSASPISSPAPTPISSPTPTPSPSPSAPTNVFTISNVPSSTETGKDFSPKVEIKLSNLANNQIYLKGAFKKADNSNYFGLTKVQNNWVKNNENYSKQFLLSLDSTGYWSGSIEVQDDTSDSGYKGEGDYIFKIGYYTSSGDGPSWSNEQIINIRETNQPATSSPSPIPSSTQPTLTSSFTPTPSTTGSYTPNISTYSSQMRTASNSAFRDQLATVAGVQESADTPYPGNNNSSLPIIALGLGILMILAAGGWYLRTKYFNVQL